MKILDDLAVCRQRVRLRARAVPQTGLTYAELHGKQTWARLRGRLERILKNSIENAGGTVLASYLERDVAVTGAIRDGSKTLNVILRGRIDLALFIRMGSSLFMALLEVTEYKNAPRVVMNRLQAYASALYGELGFPVVPVLLVMKDEDTVEDMSVMYSGIPVPGIELRRAIRRLVKVLSSETVQPPPEGELCAVCDPTLRRMCEYAPGSSA